MLRHHHRKIGFLILLIVVLVIISFVIKANIDPEVVRNFILGFGIFAPIAFIILKYLRGVFPIIPSQIMIALSGYLFGAFRGSIYCYIASVLASITLFTISRKYGRKLVMRFIYKKDLDHLNHFIKKKGLFAVIIARMLPFFPNDAINFISGLSSLTYKQFIIGTLIGLAPNVIIYNLLGQQLFIGVIDYRLIILGVIGGIFAIFYLFRHWMKIFLIKEIRFIEKKIRC